MALLVYVDDIIIASSHIAPIEALQVFLKTFFKIKSLGDLHYFLGLEVARSKHGIQLCQRNMHRILADSGLLGARPLSMPMEQNMHLSQTRGVPLSNATPFRRLIGRLLYLTSTRPDISYVVQNLSQFMQSPTDLHVCATHKVLCFIKNAPGQGLLFSSSSSLTLQAFCDSNWAFCPDSRRSVTVYYILLGQSLIS